MTKPFDIPAARLAAATSHNATALAHCLMRACDRVEGLEGAIRRLHDQVDQAMGDTDLDNDPLAEAMGHAYGLLSDQSGEGT